MRDLTLAVDTKRYCSVAMRFSIGDSLELVYSQHSGALRTLTHDAAAVLDSCRTFKTLDEHARQLGLMMTARRTQMDEVVVEASTSILPSFISKRLKNGNGQKPPRPIAIDPRQLESLKNQLNEFVADGLLVSDSEFLSVLNTPVEYEPPAQITSIAVITHDRVPMLTRCLESFIENTKRHDRQVQFVVVDDSTQPHVRKNREMLAGLRKKHRVDIYYAGPDEKRRFVGEVERRADIPGEVLSFALFGLENLGPAIGANRNSLLLQTIGEMVFSADDDTVCRIAPNPRLEDRLRFFSQGDPTQFWFFPTRDALINSTAFVEQDILALHEQMLGRELRACVAKQGEVELSQTGADFLPATCSPEQKVLFTFNGILGDSAMHSARSYFLLADESRQRLVESDSGYRSATTSREILRVVNQPTISSNWWFPTTALGVDNRDLVPPFFPMFRNEDGVFGVTGQSCFDQTYVGCLPWALLHSPGEIRSYTHSDFLRSAATCRVADILVACISAFMTVHRTTPVSERITELGTFLMEQASLSQSEFEEFVRIQLCRVGSGYASRLEADLRNHQGAPTYWADDVRTYLNTMVQGLSNQEYVVPSDLVVAGTGENPRQLMQMLVLNFGKLLWWWPRIVETTKEMKAEGIGLAVRI